MKYSIKKKQKKNINLLYRWKYIKHINEDVNNSSDSGLLFFSKQKYSNQPRQLYLRSSGFNKGKSKNSILSFRLLHLEPSEIIRYVLNQPGDKVSNFILVKQTPELA